MRPDRAVDLAAHDDPLSWGRCGSVSIHATTPQRLTEGDRIGPCRGPIRRPWEGCPGRLSRAPHPDHGNRPARRSPAYRRPLAPDVSRLLGAAPATVEIARHPQKKLGAAPERSRSASISRTGWRWGQSRVNPSRTSVSEQQTNMRIPDQPQNIPLQNLRSTRRRRRDGWKMPLKRIS